MAGRHTRTAPVGEYQPFNITAKTSVTDGIPIGARLSTTTTSTVGGAGSATITLAAISSDIAVGTRLYVWNSSGADETIAVTAVDYSLKTITAIFAQAHSGTTNVTTVNGVKIGTVVIGGLGTTVALALWNGLPGLSAATPPSTKIATITPAAPDYSFYCTADQGLFYTYTGTTAGDITVMYLTDPV